MFRIIVLLLSLQSLGTIAQAQSFSSLYLERDGLLSGYLVKKIGFQEALQQNKKIHQSFRELGFNSNANEEAMYSGFLYYYNNQVDSAQVILRKGLSEISTKNDTLNFKYLALIASLYRSSKQFDSAQVYFKKGYSLLLRKPSFDNEIPNELISFYNDFTFLLNLNGETKLRKTILDRAYDLALSVKNKDYLGLVENHLAKYYQLNGDLEKAENMYQNAILHTSKPFFRVIRYLNLAELYQEQNEWDSYANLRSFIKYDLSQVISNSHEFENLALKSNFLYARWLFHQNENGFAKKTLLDELKSVQDYRTRYESDSYLLLAQKSDFSETKFYIEKAISASLIDRNSKNLVVTNVLFSKSLISALKYKVLLSKDENEIKVALNLISQTQKAFPFEETKFSYQEEVRPFVGQLLNAVKDKPSSVFEYMEYGKSGVLNQVIREQGIKFRNVDARLIQKEKKLDRQLTKLRIDLAQDAKIPDSLKAKLDEIRIKQSFLQKEIEQKSPAYFSLKYKNYIPETSELQKGLRSNQAILNYYKQGNKLYAVLLKKNTIKGALFLLPSSFDSLLNSFLEKVYTNPGLGKYNAHAVAKTLYQYVLKDFESDLKEITSLIILRDEGLNQLPFEVLETFKGELLLQKYAITYNYSATLTLPNSNLKKQTSLLAFAPYSDTSFLKNTSRDRSLGSLPFSSLEVDQINGSVYKSQSATKSRFIEDYQKHGIIHFATHAQMDDTDPAKSFIAFYPDSSDYKLYTEELYNLSLQKTQLVILSACEAGGGKLQKGEGLMSIARGFAYAGCPAVITTLWKANDESTAWLSERLHHYLGKGWDKAEALRQAKLDFRASDLGQKFDHPYYWANFILIGDDAPLQLSFWENYRLWFLALVILLALLLVYIRLGKKPKV